MAADWREQSCTRVVRFLGADKAYRRLRQALPEWRVTGFWPDPQVAVGETFAADADAEETRTLIQTRLDDAIVELPGCPSSLPLRDCLRALPALNRQLWELSRSEQPIQEVGDLRQILGDKMIGLIRAAMDVVRDTTELALVSRSRFDKRLMFARYAMQHPKDERDHLRITVEKATPRSILISPAGDAPRQAYQCGAIPCGNGQRMDDPARTIQWIAWRPGDHGFDGPNEARPVYVQSHALDQFRDRIGTSEDGLVFDSIFQSFREPMVTQREGASFLVEHRFIGCKLGYFVVEFLGDCFLARTFLFLTMRGTPEAERLWRKRRMCRHHMEVTHLDTLAAFLVSDVRKDTVLRNLLTDCGCGHLFELAECVQSDQPLRPYAQNARRVLGIPPAHTMTAFDDPPSPG